MNVTVLQHPLAAHFLTHLRDRTTKPSLFRLLTNRLTTLLAVEASRHLRLRPHAVETPLEALEGPVLDDPLVAVPVLRAGLGMLDPIVEFFPDVSVGYIGLVRDEETAIASSYYAKLPPMNGRTTLVLDPMLATGGSAAQAIATVKAAGSGPVLMLSIIAAPEGVAALNAIHPDVPIFTAGLDRGLNAQKYILPGLGDFGDRLYGTG